MWNLKKGHKRFAYSIEITKNSFAVLHDPLWNI
jgi:hypothetical protein